MMLVLITFCNGVCGIANRHRWGSNMSDFRLSQRLLRRVARCFTNVSGQRGRSIFKDQDLQDILSVEYYTVNRVTLRILTWAVVWVAAENCSLSKYHTAPNYDPSVNNCKAMMMMMMMIIMYCLRYEHGMIMTTFIFSRISLRCTFKLRTVVFWVVAQILILRPPKRRYADKATRCHKWRYNDLNPNAVSKFTTEIFIFCERRRVTG